MKKWYEEQLERAEQAHQERVYAIAEGARERYLIPFLERHQLSFASSMGAWAIYKNGDRTLTDDEIAELTYGKDVLEVLKFAVPGWNNDLGSLMMDWEL